MGKNGKQQPENRFLEVLEIRNLLSTINVTDFGARPNDGGDDKGAILAAISASKPGDTIRFAGGTFDLSDQIFLAGGRTYQGADGGRLSGRGGSGQLLNIREDDVTIANLTIHKGGVFIEKPGGGFNKNIVIENSVFELDTFGEHPSAITFTSGLRDSRIANNYFTGYNGNGFGIYGYNYNGLTIANNEFVDVAAGMHIDAFVDSGNLLVEQNYMKGLKGMGMEFQSSARNLKFYDNFYEKPNLSNVFDHNKTSFAYSLILDKSSDIEIKRNTVIAPERPDGVGTRIAFEVGGDNTVVEENYVNGVNHVLANNDGVGSSSVLLKNNRFMNYLQGVGGIRANEIRYEGSNDGSTHLSWDIDRPRPGRKLAAENPPAQDKQDEQKDEEQKPVEKPREDSGRKPEQARPATPKPSKPAADDFVYASDLKWQSAKNGWGPVEIDRTNGERAANDGGRIILDGKTYKKGLGVAINSEVVYDLNGRFSRFFSDIGINDRTGASGSVTFQVWADGRKVYDSGVIRGADATKGVNVKVDGVKELKLVTTNGGDGDRKDHADWAAARFLPAAKPAES